MLDSEWFVSHLAPFLEADSYVVFALVNRYFRKYLKKHQRRTHISRLCRSPALLHFAYSIQAPLSARVCEYAAKDGGLEAVRAAFEAGHPLTNNVMIAAAENGDLELLKWCKAVGLVDFIPKKEYGFGRLDICYVIACRGNVALLEWAIENGLSPAHASSGAAASHSIEMIDYSIQKGWWQPYHTGKIAAQGRLDILRHLARTQDMRAAVGPAFGEGQIQVLEWLWDVALGPFTPEHFPPAGAWRAWGPLQSVMWAQKRGLQILPAPNCFDAVRWAYEHDGAALTDAMLMKAVIRGDLEHAQWLNSRGCAARKSTIVAAITYGQLALLKWLEAIGTPRPDLSTMIDVAIANEQMAILDYLFVEGSYWFWWRAACKGSLKVCTFLKERAGLPEGAEFVAAAMLKKRHFEVLEWALANGFEWTPLLTNTLHGELRKSWNDFTDTVLHRGPTASKQVFLMTRLARLCTWAAARRYSRPALQVIQDLK